MRLVIDNPNKDLFFNEFVWVFEKWEFRVRDADLFLFLRHNNHLSDSKFHFIKSILCIVINFYVDTDTCLCCCADFNDFFLNRSEECKATIRDVNNGRALGKVTNLLPYEPVYCHVIPYKADELNRIGLPTLHIEG